ncbi:MAG TPA: phage tail tape measure protein [Candidatus Acidoferrales bacterium]
MASLFSLFVDLKANTADFVSGMSTASYAAKKAGRDIQDSFSTLGDIAETALRPFGAIGEGIAQAISKIGQNAETATAGIAKLGGGLSGLAVAGGTAAGALAAVGAAAIGLAVETAESAAKIYELSKSTGISVETFSRFQFAAKQTGVDTEEMTTSLERMSKSAFAAANAPAGAINAYSRLGISLRDTSGNMRPVDDILEQVADKFSVMPDGVEKSALAMQIFGRSGDAMIAFLDRGSEGIDRLLIRSNELGDTLSTKTAKQAEVFKETLGEIEGAGKGLALSLTEFLLPSMQAVADKMVEITTQGHAWRDLFLTLAQGPIGFAQQVEARLIGSYFTDPGAPPTPKPPKPPIFGPPPIKPPTLGGVTGKDEVADLIAKLEEQSTSELKLASATSQGVAALTLQKAAGEADAKILEERTTLLDRERTLREQLANSLAGAHPEEGVKYQAEIGSVQAYLGELEKDAPKIRELYLQIAAGKLAATKANQIEEFIRKTQEQAQSVETLAQAYGPLATEQAKEAEKLAPFKQDATDLKSLIDLMRQAGASKTDLGPLVALYDQLAKNVDRAAAAIHEYTLAAEAKNFSEAFQSLQLETTEQNKYTTAVLEGAAALRQQNIEKQVTSFQNANPSLSSSEITAYRNAVTQLSDAQRAGASAQEVASSQSYKSTQQQIADLETLRQQEAARGESTAATDALIYQDRIKAVTQYQQYVFSAQNAELLGNAAIDDSQQKLTEEWDQAALKVGSVSDKFQAFFNQIKLQGDKFGETVFSSLSKAMDDVSTQLAKFVVTGKANFRQLFDSLAEEVLKAQFQKTFAALVSPIAGTPGHPAAATGPGGTAGTLPGSLSLVGSLFGGGKGAGAADGSQSNPFYTVPVDAQGNAISGAPGSTSLIGSLFKKSSGTSSDDSDSSDSSDDSSGGISGAFKNAFSGIEGVFSKVVSSVSSVVSTVGSSIGSVFKGIFGGFLAGGGGVSPGKAYIVGEKHPEFFVPHQSGQVAPSLKMQGGQVISQNFHIYGVSDADSFRRSHGQIAARWHRETSAALSRNG